MSIHNTIQKRRLAVITYQYDTATQDVIDYANTNTITLPKPSRLIVLDQLIKGLKRAGIWAKLDVLSNFAYNDANADEFALIDLVRVSEMTAFGGMSYTAQGYEGNGVDGYIDTEYNPATDGVDYLLDDASRGAVVYKQGGDIGDTLSIIDCIIAGGTNNVNTLYNTNQSAHRINSGATSLNSATNLSGTGFTSIIRDNSTNVRLVKNATEFNRTATSTAIQSSNQGLFKRGASYSNVGLSNYMMGASLTYAETQTFRALYNTYLSAIGLTPIA